MLSQNNNTSISVGRSWKPNLICRVFYVIVDYWNTTQCRHKCFKVICFPLRVKKHYFIYNTSKQFRIILCWIFFKIYLYLTPMLVAARCKVRVGGLSLAAIPGSNPTGVMNICLLWVLCCQVEGMEWRVNHSSKRVLPILMCLSVISKTR